jgi:hypothetical protein
MTIQQIASKIQEQAIAAYKNRYHPERKADFTFDNTETT